MSIPQVAEAVDGGGRHAFTFLHVLSEGTRFGWTFNDRRGPDVPEELIGVVSHYFAKPEVGVVTLTADVKVGDTLHFSGHGVDFQQAVTSMQVDHAPVEAASSGTAVAMKVAQKVREGTQVYRIVP